MVAAAFHVFKHLLRQGTTIAAACTMPRAMKEGARRGDTEEPCTPTQNRGVPAPQQQQLQQQDARAQDEKFNAQPTTTHGDSGQDEWIKGLLEEAQVLSVQAAASQERKRVLEEQLRQLRSANTLPPDQEGVVVHEEAAVAEKLSQASFYVLLDWGSYVACSGAVWRSFQHLA